MSIPNGITSVAKDTVDALKTSPVLLLIVLLNMAFAGSAGFYLIHVEDARAADRVQLLSLLEKCTLHTVPLEALPNFQQRKEP